MSIFQEIDTNYDIEHTSAFCRRYWWAPWVSTSLYLILIAVGKKWMESKQPYGMRKLLFVWNLCLALFSMLGAWVILPSLWDMWAQHGFEYSVCNSTILTVPLHSFFCLLFVLSKIVEFGDTFFVIMRKTPLNFLHWYHHVTVCFFSWHSLAIKSTPAHWFCALNYVVHSVMYSYYVIKSTGTKLPKFVSVAITGLQLLQFVVGLVVVCVTAHVQLYRGEFCNCTATNIAIGVMVYFSYLVLFGNFFYQRYLKPRKEKVY